MADDGKLATAFAAHAKEQRRAWRKLSHLERLRWLEDAKRFYAIALGAARRTRRMQDVRDSEV